MLNATATEVSLSMFTFRWGFLRFCFFFTSTAGTSIAHVSFRSIIQSFSLSSFIGRKARPSIVQQNDKTKSR